MGSNLIKVFKCQYLFQNMIKLMWRGIHNRLGGLSSSTASFNRIQPLKSPLLAENKNGLQKLIDLSLLSPLVTRCGSTWRYPELNQHYAGAYPNKVKHHTHHKHLKNIKIHTYGIQKQTRLRPVCNAQIGREALAEGKPPKVIQVYSKVHARKSHGAYGKLGDKVLMTIKGEMKKGIVVGLKVPQLHGIPRFDTNNVVLIEDNGSPIGNRINVPIPNCIKPILKRNSHAKKADYTKLFSIATKFV